MQRADGSIILKGETYTSFKGILKKIFEGSTNYISSEVKIETSESLWYLLHTVMFPDVKFLEDRHIACHILNISAKRIPKDFSPTLMRMISTACRGVVDKELAHSLLEGDRIRAKDTSLGDIMIYTYELPEPYCGLLVEYDLNKLDLPNKDAYQGDSVIGPGLASIQLLTGANIPYEGFEPILSLRNILERLPGYRADVICSIHQTAPRGALCWKCQEEEQELSQRREQIEEDFRDKVSRLQKLEEEELARKALRHEGFREKVKDSVLAAIAEGRNLNKKFAGYMVDEMFSQQDAADAGWFSAGAVVTKHWDDWRPERIEAYWNAHDIDKHRLDDEIRAERSEQETLLQQIHGIEHELTLLEGIRGIFKGKQREQLQNDLRKARQRLSNNVCAIDTAKAKLESYPPDDKKTDKIVSR